jgi:hypothetical protein
MYEARENSAQSRGALQRRLRISIASLATALALSACGGGGDITSSGVFNFGVVIGGQVVSEPPVVAGGSLSLVIHAGQSLRLDAGEPVFWTLYIGGTAVTLGAQVFYAGLDITGTTVSSSAIVVDTFAASPLSAAIPITLVATSTIDSAQVATVDVLITN